MVIISKRIYHRFQKSLLQYGILATIGRCLVWPFMYLSWRIVERTPIERQRLKAGEDFDKNHNVESVRTRGSEWAADIESENWAEGTGYEATPAGLVRRSIEMLGINHEEFTFLDIGSGKGRVMLVAAEFPFMKILGVEYDPDLHEIAARNILAYRNNAQRCMDIKSFCHDAVTFPLPITPLVLFFHHPFGEIVLNRFLESVRISLQDHPRKIYVIYYDPICGETFANAGFREVASQVRGSTNLPREVGHKRPLWLSRIAFHNSLGEEFAIYEK